MKRSMYLKAVSMLLSLMVVMTSTLTVVQPKAYAQPNGQENVKVEHQDEGSVLSKPDKGDGTPPSVTDVVYDKDGNILPNPIGDSNEEAARLLAAATFSGTNLALHKTAFSSGNEVDYLGPELAVDGKGNTRWSSAKEDDQWFYVDLGEKKAFDRVVIRWQTPADTYKILVSDDAQNWTNVKDNDGSIQCKGGVETVDFPSLEARYVKFQGVKRAPVDGVLYGYPFLNLRCIN